MSCGEQLTLLVHEEQRPGALAGGSGNESYRAVGRARGAVLYHPQLFDSFLEPVL
jgi:hypothetical protein